MVVGCHCVFGGIALAPHFLRMPQAVTANCRRIAELQRGRELGHLLSVLLFKLFFPFLLSPLRGFLDNFGCATIRTVNNSLLSGVLLKVKYSNKLPQQTPLIQNEIIIISEIWEYSLSIGNVFWWRSNGSTPDQIYYLSSPGGTFWVRLKDTHNSYVFFFLSN